MSGKGGAVQELKVGKLFPFFYGYVILFACTVGKILTAPGQSPCIGVVIGVIVKDLDISLTTVTASYFIATTTSAVCLTKMGKIIDRFGVQNMVAIIATMLGAACFVASIAQNVPTLLVAFFMLRFFGQGSLMMVSKTTINYWWIELRGTMMGVAGAMVSLGMTGVFPIILNIGIENVGWRAVYVNLGFTSILFMAPFGYMFYRPQPENFGLLPDGKDPAVAVAHTAKEKSGESEEAAPDDDAAAASDGDNNNNSEVNWEAKDAFKTMRFWSNTTSVAVIAATATAFWFHLKSVMVDYSIDSGLVHVIYPILAVSGFIGRIWSGRLIDTFEENGYLVLVIGLLLQVVAMVLIPTMAIHEGFLVLICILQGFASSFVQNTSSVVFANFFGRAHLAEIQGRVDAFGVLGSAIGPFPFGFVRDLTGSFNSAFMVGAIFPLCCAILVYYEGRKFAEEHYDIHIKLTQYEHVTTNDLSAEEEDPHEFEMVDV